MALLVAQATSTQGNSTAVSTPGLTTTAGTLLVVAVTCASNLETGTPFTDTYGNTWSDAIGAQVGNGVFIHMVYAKNITAGLSHTVTYNTTSNSFNALFLLEIFGADTTTPLDKTAVHTASNESNPHSCGTTATTTQAEEVCVSLYSDSTGSGLFSSNNGYTVQAVESGNIGWDGVITTKLVYATGAQGDSLVRTASTRINKNAGTATFKAGAVPASTGDEGRQLPSPRF